MKIPADMTAMLALVRARLDREGHGSRSTLGSLMGVTPVTLSNWLADEPRRHPDGEPGRFETRDSVVQQS